MRERGRLETTASGHRPGSVPGAVAAFEPRHAVGCRDAEGAAETTEVRIPTPRGPMPGYLATTTGAATRLERALAAVGVDHDVKEYPDAGHAFLDDHHDVVSRLMRVPNIGYHATSAQDARRRIIAFFDRHLKPTGGLPAPDTLH